MKNVREYPHSRLPDIDLVKSRCDRASEIVRSHLDYGYQKIEDEGIELIEFFCDSVVILFAAPRDAIASEVDVYGSRDVRVIRNYENHVPMHLEESGIFRVSFPVGKIECIESFYQGPHSRLP